MTQFDCSGHDYVHFCDVLNFQFDKNAKKM